ncbi:helix-turn-helix transcriptional regulator [Diaphorobacter sp. HDW4A]|nr:helix-turn-helix transcriptional regulator [Diaphorobacter sp. HDW4A]
MEIGLGEKLKLLRLNKNIEQKTLAARAGVSVRALRNLESGGGTTVKTLLSVVRALGRESWLDTVAPVPTVNPLTFTSRATQRQRARSKGEVGRTPPAYMASQASSSSSAAPLQVDSLDPLRIKY